VLVDPERAPVIKQIFEKFAYEGWSGMKVFHWLKFDLNFRTKNNHHLTLGNVYLILQNQFYYGILEYPKHSGKLYTGKHEPLITRELFEKANDQLKRREKNKEAKEFAFTRLITCDLCGSGVTANERIKEFKNGNSHRYVYYGCTRSRDHKCQAGYIREDELIRQLLVIIDLVDVNELGIKHKFDEEVGRFRKFQRSVLGANPGRVETDDVDIKNYVKYLLAEGSITEKRELLACLKSRLVFKDKTIQLAEDKATQPKI
jgi:hypothetical protein